MNCYDTKPRCCSVLILLSFCVFLANCKKQERTPDELDRSVQFIAVDGFATFSFRSETASQCEVIWANTSYECKKPTGSMVTWQAPLGEFDPKQRPRVELHLLLADRGEPLRRTYIWRQVGARLKYDYRVKLNIPLATAELVRVEMPMPAIESPKTGCQMVATGERIVRNMEVPFAITELTTSGFGAASAAHHRRDNRYVRLNYDEFTHEQDLSFRYVLENKETIFALRPPATFQAVAANSEHSVPLVDTLVRRRRGGKVGNSSPLEVTWQINNPTPKMRLSIFITSDDKDTQAKCFADPKEERMKLEHAFLQQLPTGNYSLLVQLHSTQRVGIAGTPNTSWLVDTYDWRQGAFEKL